MAMTAKKKALSKAIKASIRAEAAGIPKREQNGRVQRGSREERREDMRAVGYQGRERVYRMPPEMAREAPAETVFGRLYLQRELAPSEPKRNKAMYEAGLAYYEARKLYLRAILARSLASGGDLERQSGFDGSDGADPSYIASCEAATRNITELRSVVSQCGEPLALHALEWIVGEDSPMYAYVGELRAALNALLREKARREDMQRRAA